jgi:hypothetical protein
MKHHFRRAGPGEPLAGVAMGNSLIGGGESKQSSYRQMKRHFPHVGQHLLLGGSTIAPC